MSCHEYDADLVDLARNGSSLAGSPELRGHLARCQECAARYRDERMLNEGLQALVAAAATVPENHAAERQLMNAFASHVASGRASARARPGVPWWAVAAAASLVLLAG
jgi:hypothetical protein